MKPKYGIFFLNKITIKVPKCTKYGIKVSISSDLGSVSSILTFPIILGVDKQDGSFKVLPRFFSKILSIPVTGDTNLFLMKILTKIS